MYAKEAVFHDPIGIAEGIESIRAQFNGLVKVSAWLDECSVPHIEHRHVS